MKTLIQNLIDEAKTARTSDGHVYLIRLLRERENGVPEAYERLGRCVPLSVLRLPGVPSIEELGPRASEVPWVAILHGNEATLVPISKS